MNFRKTAAMTVVTCMLVSMLGGCSRAQITEDMIPVVADLNEDTQTFDKADVLSLSTDTTGIDELPEEEEAEEEPEVEEIFVVLKATSMEKDLKIKFVNQKTGKVITGTAFAVDVAVSRQKGKEYRDDDKDGIIYIKNLEGGSYTITVTQLGDCVGGETITATVKAKIEYKVVDVTDEIKSESEINTAVEDAGQGAADASTQNVTLQDTVDFVVSTKTEEGETPKVQKVDAWGQKVYTKLMLDKYGTEMYAKILSEPDADHVDADSDLVCDRCGAAVKPPHTHSFTETVKPPTCIDQGYTEYSCSCGESYQDNFLSPDADAHSFKDNICEFCGAADVQQQSENPEGEASVVGMRRAIVGAAPNKIVYDKTSAPVYDTTSEPVFEEGSGASKPSSGGSQTVKYTGWQTIDGKTYYFDADGNKVTGTQVIQGVQYTFDKNGVRTGSIGIDVSKFQSAINWAQVKNAGINFVYVRCGYRGYGSGVLVEDSMFRSHVAGAKAAGLKVGLYYFSQAVSEAEAVEEASMAVSLARSVGGISLPIAIDSEYAAGGAGRADGLGKSERTSITKAFCNTISNSGYTPMVYASKQWFGEHLNVSALGGYRIWVAHYAETCGYTGRYDLWQYTSSGSVPGVNGRVDMDISYM